ncbi:hypothetical protein U1Q18_034568 [Sarracenia purpurea var. burkii]
MTGRNKDSGVSEVYIPSAPPLLEPNGIYFSACKEVLEAKPPETCSKGRCLLPVKFRERNPQRVCDACYDKLDPSQGAKGLAILTVAKAGMLVAYKLGLVWLLPEDQMDHDLRHQL